MRSTAASWAILKTGRAIRGWRRIRGGPAAARTESGRARRRWRTVRCFSRRTASTGSIRRPRARIRSWCRSVRVCRTGQARASWWWTTGCITSRAWACACTTGACRRRSAAASARCCMPTRPRAVCAGNTSSAWRMRRTAGRCSSTTRARVCGTGRTARTQASLRGSATSCISLKMERSGPFTAQPGRRTGRSGGWRRRGS